jgi:hypothetical protein
MRPRSQLPYAVTPIPAPTRPSRPRRVPPHSGTYLTDEVFLYRVVDVRVTGAGEMAELEDCYWLDIVRVPISDVLARRLRVVTPT